MTAAHNYVMLNGGLVRLENNGIATPLVSLNKISPDLVDDDELAEYDELEDPDDEPSGPAPIATVALRMSSLPKMFQ
jgi:hypothetical protein